MIDKRAVSISSYTFTVWEGGGVLGQGPAHYWRHTQTQDSLIHMQIGLVATEPVTSHERTDAGHRTHSKPIRRAHIGPSSTPSGVFVSLLGDRQKQRRHDCIIASITEIIYTSIISPSAHIPGSLSITYCHYSSLITTFTQLRHAKISSQRQIIGVCPITAEWKRKLSECVWGWCTRCAL